MNYDFIADIMIIISIIITLFFDNKHYKGNFVDQQEILRNMNYSGLVLFNKF